MAVDLEDAVAASAKAAARHTAITSAAPRAGLFLRINPLDGPWADGDLAAAHAVLPRPAGLIVPKAEDPDALRALDRDLTTAEETAGLPAGRTALLAGQSVTDVSQNAFANLGWEKITLPHPVFDGDTIHSRSSVEAVRESRSRPTLGVVTVATTGVEQTGEVVIEFLRTLLVYKRGHGPRFEES